MPSPFEDGGTTKTIDIPPVDVEPPRKGSALPWAAVIAAVLVALVILVIAVVLVT